MANQHLKLVYSSSESDRAREDFEVWKQETLDRLDQLDLCHYRIVVFNVDSANCSQFYHVMETYKPALAIQTAKIAGYYQIFKSYKHLIKGFESMGIKYDEIPLQFINDDADEYRPIEEVRQCIRRNHDYNANPPIFMLSSAEFHCGKIFERLKSFCLTNMPNAKLELLQFY